MVLAVCGAERRESGCSRIDHEVVMRSKLDLNFLCSPVSHSTSTPFPPATTEPKEGGGMVCGSYPIASCTEIPNTCLIIKQIYVVGDITSNHSRAIWGKHHRTFPEWQRDKDGYSPLVSSLMLTVDRVRMRIILRVILLLPWGHFRSFDITVACPQMSFAWIMYLVLPRITKIFPQ